MHSKAKESFVKRLIDVVSHVTIVLSDSHLHDIAEQDYMLLNENIALVDGVLIQYEKLCKDIMTKLRCGEIVSESTVKKALKQLVIRLVEENDYTRASLYFDELIDDFENYSKEQIIYIPLDSIEMHDVDELEVGRITLRKMTDVQIDALIKNIEAVLMQTSHSAEEKPLLIEHYSKYLKNFRGKVCAEFRFVAEPEIAKERAEEESRRVIDLLRYAIPHLYDFWYPVNWYSPLKRKEEKRNKKKSEYRTRTRIGVGLQGEVGTGIRETLIFPSTADSFNMYGQYIGMRPFSLSQQNITLMKQIGVFKVAEILKKDKKSVTSFEDVLLRSIHWFANAQTQFEIENELLNLVTSLETLLTSASDNLMDTVSYGIAFMLTDNIDQRRDFISRYKEIYGQRSSTSHHGHENADEVDLIELRYVASNAIRMVIKNLNRWTEQEQLFEWIRTMKISGKASETNPSATSQEE